MLTFDMLLPTPVCIIAEKTTFLENGGYPVGGAEVLLVVPLEHERARGAATPRSAPTAFDEFFANTARKTFSNFKNC